MKFQEIIQNKIEIPLIQRDYVQGLDEKKARRFLKAIKEGMQRDGLNLDFIYGNRKDAKFIPIDGQQRLTTLFLLYFYLSLEGEYLQNLQHFSYAIRPTSKEFFTALSKKENWEKLKKRNIVEQIKNSSWYFLSWEQDLTVQSALKMLELIEAMFWDLSIRDLEKIEFEFLDLDEYSLGEDLYIKMNARGKQLSDFENFKAEFESYIDDVNIRAKLDNEWFDLFWKLDLKRADELFYNFFYNTTLNFYLEKGEIDKNFTKEKNLFDFYNDVYKEKEYVGKVVKLLDNLHKYEKLQKFCESKEISYAKRLNFYTWSLGILKDFDDTQMRRWQRIALNLVKNTRIEDPKSFVNALRGLLQLSQTIENDIYEEIDFSNVQGFSKEQIAEEERKVSLINSDSMWEEELVEAENHWYLDGQVGFLLDFSEEQLSRFTAYKEKFFLLFNKDVKDVKNDKNDKKKQTLIQRALLTIEDYLPAHDWRRKTFCSFDTMLRVKQENWRKVFGKDCFKELLDSVTRFEDLQYLIDAYTFSFDDWKSYFINPKEDWSVLEDAKNYQIVFESEDKIFLNSSPDNNIRPFQWGWRNAKELYTWYLFRKFFLLKPQEKREVWWRLEADVDKKRYGLVYYFDPAFSSGEAGIWVEKEGKEFQIYYKGENELSVRDYKEKKDIQVFPLKSVLSKEVVLFEIIAAL